MRYKIGLDLGVGSVGWAVVECNEKGEGKRIIDLNSRIFTKAENPKDGSSLATKRREARGSRRRLRRKKHRIDRVKYLLEKNNIITINEINQMYEEYKFPINVYELRVEALDRKLTERELARVLINFMKKRGYKSNSKSEEASDKELGKLLSATRENSELMQLKNYRTIAEMYIKDDKYSFIDINGKKNLCIRNSEGNYKSTVLRSQLLNELTMILEKQKELNDKITEDFVQECLDIFTSQRDFDEGPGGDSKYGGNLIEKMIGKCSLEKNELRAVKASYTFEYFKLLQDINHIKILTITEVDGVRKYEKRELTKEEREILIKLAKKSENLQYKKIRKELKLNENQIFNMLTYNFKKDKIREEVIKEAEDKAKLVEFKSYNEIRKKLDKIEKGYIEKLSYDDLDKIGYALTAYKNDDKRIEYLKENNVELEEEALEKILELSFAKTGNLSIKAMKKIIPYLEDGLTYDKAVDSVDGYKFTNRKSDKKKTKLSLNDLEQEIANPVVRRAVSQCIKVVNAIVAKYGKPDLVNIELAREVAKNFRERKELENKMKENQATNEKAKQQIEELVGNQKRVTGLDIIKYKLWKEQNEVSMYSGKKITIEQLFSGDTDVDHIIPYSKCYDDSYTNKVVVFASENREKGNRIPLDYLKENGSNIGAYQVLVDNTIKNFKKKRKLLTENLTQDMIDGFKERNLNDTQYLSRVMHNLIRNNLDFNPNDNLNRRVYVINGTITSQVRKRLGIEKIRADGDKHHAVDAVVIAAISPKLITNISNYYSSKENIKDKGDFELEFPEPWPNFRKELEIRLFNDEEYMKKALKEEKFYTTYPSFEDIKPLFVSRMPNRKITGAAHLDTVRGLKVDENGKAKSVTKTPLKKLKLKTPKGETPYIEGYNEKLQRDDRLLYEALLARLIEFNGNAEKAFEAPFYRPKKDGTNGPLVKKVKIEDNISLYVSLNKNKALAANGDMVRIDVFKIENDGYYLVPIYVSDTIKDTLPNKAVVANKPYSQWKEMRDEDFIFSIYSNDLIYVKGKKEINTKLSVDDEKIAEKTKSFDGLLGYYCSADISSASIKLTSHDSKYFIRGLGIKTLKEFKKFEVDVLGEYHEVKLPEKRQTFKSMRGGKA